MSLLADTARRTLDAMDEARFTLVLDLIEKGLVAKQEGETTPMTIKRVFSDLSGNSQVDSVEYWLEYFNVK